MKKNYLQLMEAATAYVAEERVKILAPEDAANFLRPLTQGEPQETLYAFFLNTRNEIIEFCIITKGLVDRTAIHAREVFRPALLNNAVRIVLAHNHPSGDHTPSQGDIRSTRELIEAGKIIGIEVVDHVVIGEKTASRKVDYSSLRELGYM